MYNKLDMCGYLCKHSKGHACSMNKLYHDSDTHITQIRQKIKFICDVACKNGPVGGIGCHLDKRIGGHRNLN